MKKNKSGYVCDICSKQKPDVTLYNTLYHCRKCLKKEKGAK